MNYEEWKHHVNLVNECLQRNQRKMRVAVVWVFLVGLAFAISMVSIAPTDNFEAFRVVPWVFICALLLGVFWMVYVGRMTEKAIRAMLDSFNREFVPRGIQWKLHVHQHHKKRVYYVIIIMKRNR